MIFETIHGSPPWVAKVDALSTSLVGRRRASVHHHEHVCHFSRHRRSPIACEGATLFPWSLNSPRQPPACSVVQLQPPAVKVRPARMLEGARRDEWQWDCMEETRAFEQAIRAVPSKANRFIEEHTDVLVAAAVIQQSTRRHQLIVAQFGNALLVVG